MCCVGTAQKRILSSELFSHCNEHRSIENRKELPALLSRIQMHDFAMMRDLTSHKHMWLPPAQAFVRKLDNRRSHHDLALVFETILYRRGYRAQISYPPDQMEQCVLTCTAVHWIALAAPVNDRQITIKKVPP